MGAPARSVTRTTCAVVGGGPAGAMLSLLLARAGVSVTLLEAHPDFDREFRGDTLHPSVMEVMDQLGLAGRLLELRHSKVRSFTLDTPKGPFTPVDFSRLNTRFPYITMMPQASFLEFLTAEARRYPGFRLVMGARVRELVEEGGAVRGVRYESGDGTHEVRASLTVGADGRGSRVRRLAGFEPVKTSPPMDVVWFRVPRSPGDPEGAMARFGRGRIVVLLDRDDHWQAGYVIPKGTFPELRRAGVEGLKVGFAELFPELSDRLAALGDRRQVSLLSVESSRCRRWHRPGLLLIGDAAHVMSPVGGVGINYAIGDAVVAANVLAGPLRECQERLVALPERHLAAVQRRREPPVRTIQALQALVQRRVLAPTLAAGRPFAPPLPLRLLSRAPLLRSVPARIIGFGPLPARVDLPQGGVERAGPPG
ncbi:monooxygenase, FAD-binding protein [Rubrobacter xylanophilus DSM 9941]|uniref:Monooxygenase, FAD-binding protein n=1 Tax=Rubrobacter xylanophilus (strain DSM 9941 / JCM 11954 / NBRC 16129 / PRD-1) TaxID=266117 RepID=Q1AYW7_RUBXD|nr:FAD-dependent oxidoreductase [Rubrobacter xylanophilus]ABG03411.1 monooxygenase, FAD-binding protein [Rubrobacter xylanophilus DSM 9941]